MSSEEKVSVSKQTLDFLMYSYFGFTQDDDFETILDAVIDKAYKDATNQGAYNTKLDDSNKNESKEAKDEARNHLKETIRNYESQGEGFDEWHEKLCGGIKNKYSGIKIFTYGNAQKWVNMTVKYLYMLADIRDDKSIQEIKKDKKYLHIPIDSYIIDALWFLDIDKLPVKEEYKSKRGNGYPYKKPSDFVEGWSKWDYVTYNKVWKDEDTNTGISTECKPTPIEWEFDTWIKEAKKRKGGHK